MSWTDFAAFAFGILGLLGSIHVFLHLWAYQFPDGKVRHRLNPPPPPNQVTLVIEGEDKDLLRRAVKSMENLEKQAQKPQPHPATTWLLQRLRDLETDGSAEGFRGPAH
jgi:hypothetical protein